MNYFKFYFVLFSIFFLLVVPSRQSFNPQPRIVSSSGHLVFNSAENKDIRFVTKGGGKIFLNEGDLSDAATLARNATETLARINGEFYDTSFQVQRIKRLLGGQRGILQRLVSLENGAVSSHNGTSILPDYNLSIINRRLRILQRKMNALMILLSKNECTSNPCHNGGTCIDLVDAFFCKCFNAWEGPTCVDDVNECLLYSGTDLGCQNGATCINTPGSYSCICPSGYLGIHCTSQNASCSSGSSEDLCGHGTCIPQANSYKCLCDQGWKSEKANGACTLDVDECSNIKPPCSVNPPVACINIPGGFTCGSCPAGYTGNGHYCTDIDECAIFNGGCSTNPMVRCMNTPGSKICGACPPGYVGDGTICDFQGLCRINNGGCNPLAQCRDNPRISSTYVECICPAGYVGSGVGPSGCVHSTNADPCASNPCIHGSCIPSISTGTYSCLCNLKFTGIHCDIRKDPCLSNPCMNGGTCQNIANLSYKCTCPEGYTGDECQTERQACGGRLRSLTGTLKFPPSTNTHYDNKINCAWVIQTNSTKVLNITFTEFHLEASNNCRYDWLQIHDGFNSAAHSLGRFCGNTFPLGGTITSSHNSVYLWFRSDPTVSNAGFTLNWETVNPACGSNIVVDSHGTIVSPGFPGNYPPNRDCYWYLQAQQGKRIQFHFFSLMIGNNSNCSFDHLTIYKSSIASNHIIGKYCNTSHPEPLISSGSEVVVHFHSDAANGYPGFQLAYSVMEGIPGCGGVYTLTDGEISSPTVEGRYPPNINCEYKITVIEASRIKITFMSFDLEEDSNCEYDFVEIHEGSLSSSPLIGRYCGDRIPPPYLSVGNQLVVIFNSDWGNNEAGFRMKYSTVCGGIYTEPSGVITSPGFPNSYDVDLICIYEINQPIGKTIQLTFSDFDIESSIYSSCMFDFVEIHDGDNENSTVIGRYCAEKPPDIQSTYNYLWLKFESDSSVSETGFRANYTTVDMGCGGIMKQSAGTVESPRENAQYPSSTSCTWIITAPEGKVIQLSWSSFQLEDSNRCTFDYVKIYNNYNVNETIGVYCGSTLPPVLISSTNVLSIKFVTDYSINRDGFVASYRFMDEVNTCGGRFYTSSGLIKSPFYPSNYPNNRECTWLITVQPGQQILLKVKDFQLEAYSRCNYDFVEIRNGGSATSPLIGKYCGTNIPKQIPSLTHQMFIYFKSDMSQRERGFELSWESAATGCGGILTSPSGLITSPNYPEPYNDNARCNWRISVNAGSMIQLVISDMDLENHQECSLDSLQIYDGPNIKSKILATYCNSESSSLPVIKSTSNHLTIVFETDSSVQYRGFSMQYNTLCSNNITGLRGVIESPNFPDVYPFNLDCKWTIKVNPGNKINITFTHFNLMRSHFSFSQGTNCSADYVQVSYELASELSAQYGKYCEAVTPPSLIALQSNIAEIHFVSDSLLLGNGFRLEWQNEGCGGLLTRPSGTFSTPGFPNGYPEATQCDWIIELEYGKSVQLTFTEIDLETSYNCNYDYIMVVNGPDLTYPMLSKLCSKATKPVVITSTGNFVSVKFESDYSYKGRGFFANYTSVSTKCGGKLSASIGAFHSPYYPKNYDIGDTCEWLIDLEEGHMVELSFEDVDLSGACTTNYIKVYDGSSTSDPVLNTICGSSKPNSTIKSTSNQMVVEMRTDAEYPAKGFLANYTTACGARIVTDSDGFIKLTDTGLSSTELDNCTWTIIASDPTKHVSLSITHMDSMECYGNYYKIQVYAGESSSSPLIAKYCDGRLPPTIVSEGNSLHIVINSPYINFIAKYSIIGTACGGVLTGVEGNFGTPNYPNNYPINTECEWILQVAPGNKVSLSFSDFELVTSENCYVDYLEIRESNSSGKLLGSYCDVMPTNLTQLGNIWLYFKSSPIPGDNSGSTAKGFMAEYSLIHGIDLSGPSGQIGSPLYPLSYFKTGTFEWRVTVNYGKSISILFKDFYIESYSDEDCFLSDLEIFDGFDEQAPSLGKLCGVRIPEPIKSTSNVVYIKMSLDSIRRGSKFLIEWLEVTISSTNPTNKKPRVDGCGSAEVINLSGLKNYNLTSPGYPNGYGENLDCEWIFSCEPENHLYIRFLKMDLENMIDQCLMDSVKIYKGKNGVQDWELVDNACLPNATIAENIYTNNLMKVIFHTDSYSNGSGFNAYVIKGCGGSIYQSNGVISVNETYYSYAMTCEWNITVNPGRKIEVSFQDVNIVGHSNDPCDNYILLKNGHYPSSPFLGSGKYCNNSIPSLTTTGNYLYVKYVGYPSTGFQMTYKEVSEACGATVRLSKFESEVNITSPNYPNVPLPYSECFWTIIGPPGELLRIDFEERFDLTKSDDCKNAAVEIFDGGSKYSPMLGTYCSHFLPNSSFSSNNMMFIRFFTAVHDPRNGFKAKISIASCGGTLVSRTGEIHSPNFNVKNMYPKNAYCVWRLIGPSDHYLQLNFLKIDLMQEGTCNVSTDYVKIEEPYRSNNRMSTVGMYCGNINPGLITSSSNEVVVKFATGNYSPLRAGFSLNFTTGREECGGKLNTEFGVIQSPGYPNGISKNRECEWFITVQEGRRITLQFLDLNMNLHGYSNSLMVFDSDQYNSILLSEASSNVSIVKSSSNTMLIWLWSMKSTNYRGFRARYSSDEPTICVGDFNQTSGVINYLNESLYFCVWKHYMGSITNKTLSMAITLESLVNKNLCTNAKGPIMITGKDHSDIISRFCRTIDRPFIVRSPHLITQLIINKMRSVNETMRYTVNYKENPCGGIITGEEGFISTPNYPNKYPNDVECAWLLKLPKDQRVRVNFTNVNLDSNCEYNYITIYNGEYPTSPNIGLFCRSNLPTVIHAQSNVLLIEYHYDARSSATGFKLKYDPIIDGCSGIFHDDTRIIETPLYPKDYPNNTECSWEVIVKNGYYVLFEFIDRFYIEQTPNCAKDFVELFDYVDNNYKSMGKFCGRERPQNFYSQSNRLKILFRSNENIRATGFKAKWNIHCGGNFEAGVDKNYILSPGYPDHYVNDLLCVYNITSINNFVNIIFEDFLLENEDICRFDNVTFEGISHSYYPPADMITKPYCGTNKPPFIRQRDGVIIRFSTDSWVTRKGFRLTYQKDDCGGIITEPRLIRSPGISEENGVKVYASSMLCMWNITAPANKNVVIRFNYFHFEHSYYCSYDSVAIYEGISTNDSLRLALLCGNLTDTLPVVKTKGNSMTVVMKTDYTNHFAGFEAVVFFDYGPSSGCGGVINVNDTTIIEAPTGISYADCHWEIMTERDYVLKLVFTDLHLIPCTYNSSTKYGQQICHCDIIEIRDGGSFLSELISRLCDNTVPSEYTTTSHSAWIRLSIQETSRIKSFKLTVTKIMSVCGPSVLNVTNEVQVLKSPFYPRVYPSNIKCIWKLRSPHYADKFDLRFVDFDLTDASEQDVISQTCSSDRVEIVDKTFQKYIYDGLGSALVFGGVKLPAIYGTSPVGTHQFCGTHALAFDHYTGKNEASVSFYSGPSTAFRRGFKMEYRLAGCNRNFTSVQGRLVNSRLQGDCTIIINVPENNTVSLYFLSFVLYDRGQCTQAGMEIYDGATTSDPLLAKACGFNIPNPIFSRGNKLRIHFYNLDANVVNFYDIIYTSSSEGKGCGGVFYNYGGKFTSPFYPAIYRQTKVCTWEIWVPQGLQVSFKLTVFDVGGTCTSDFVNVKTYSADNSVATDHRFCKEDNPAILRSENNHMTVTYTSSLNNGGTGWIAEFVGESADNVMKL